MSVTSSCRCACAQAQQWSSSMRSLLLHSRINCVKLPLWDSEGGVYGGPQCTMHFILGHAVLRCPLSQPGVPWLGVASPCVVHSALPAICVADPGFLHAGFPPAGAQLVQQKVCNWLVSSVGRSLLQCAALYLRSTGAWQDVHACPAAAVYRRHCCCMLACPAQCVPHTCCTACVPFAFMMRTNAAAGVPFCLQCHSAAHRGNILHNVPLPAAFRWHLFGERQSSQAAALIQD
jgi:hypothetical protein